MPLGSHHIDSYFKLIAPPLGIPISKVEVKPKDIKSGPGSPPTTGSYGHAVPILLTGKDARGKRIWINKTSNNTFWADDVTENGYFSPQIDDGIRRGAYQYSTIDKWEFAGEKNPPRNHNLVQKMPDFGLIVSPRLGMYFPNEGDTPVSLRTSHDTVNAVDPDRLGYFHSKLANFNQDLRNLIYNDANRLNYEATEWINFLANKGISIDTTPKPGILGLGILNSERDYAAAYHPNGYLIAYNRFQKLAKNWISKYGLVEPEAVEAMKRSIMLHEFGHVLGIGGSKKDEKLQGLLQAEFYSMMSQRFRGTKMEIIYRALAQEGRDYAKEFSTTLADLIFGESRDDNTEIRKIEHKFWKDAIELGVRDIEGYVEMRMEETLGPILRGEPSYRTSKKYSKSKSPKLKTSKNPNSKTLEEKILDESDRVSFTMTEDGEIVPTYKGGIVFGEGASMPVHLIVGKGKEYNDTKTNTYEGNVNGKNYRSMEDVKANLRRGENAESAKAGEGAPEPTEAMAEASAE